MPTENFRIGLEMTCYSCRLYKCDVALKVVCLGLFRSGAVVNRGDSAAALSVSHGCSYGRASHAERNQ